MSRSYLILSDKLVSFTSGCDQYVITSSNYENIGIKQTQEFIAWTHLKPYNHDRKVGIISFADALTKEAQNNLLKTLEEPPHNTHIILIAKNRHALISTIQSRCHIYTYSYAKEHVLPEILLYSNITSSIQEEQVELDIQTFISTMTSHQLPTVFSYIKDFSDSHTRQDSITLLENAVYCLYQRFLKSDDISCIPDISHIEDAKQAISKNANIQLTLEHLFFSLHE